MFIVAEFIELLKQYPQDAEVNIGVMHPQVGYVFSTLMPELHVDFQEHDVDVTLHSRKILCIGGKI